MVAANEKLIWNRMMSPGLDDISSEAAEAILALKFTRADRNRVRTLSALAKRDRLDDARRTELELYLQIGNVLMLLHSRARVALKRHGAARVGRARA